MYALKYRVDPQGPYFYLASFDDLSRARFYVEEMKKRNPDRSYQVFRLDAEGNYSILVKEDSPKD